ncbi:MULTISPECIES: UDP-N-acetylmuramoyl-L-alanine--D-glutamate ligase [Roseicyclus]|uniref:UDP-N-acetylmuramoylalanine--D-glutamate ligase n=1 Tax=Roseicyclus marinus TaxID=2161673 RepID=A0AA48H5N9_9RHOB|nr:UDP-N-acetylmuramoylalanine--D-glutamate ligase [Roseicyclus marinus]
MIPVQGFDGQRVAVLGLGRSGLATARALRAGGAEALCWDDGAAAREVAAGEGFVVQDPCAEGALEGVAALITSPGIPHLYPKPHRAIAAAWAAGVPVDNDVGLFFRSLALSDWGDLDEPPKVVAVTGSNGKSTTSALIAHVLEAAGRPVQLAGNIGRGVLDIDPPGEGGVVVLELSSYQIDLARALTPDIAVFTNLSPDHLDRHGGMGGYFAAKARLFTMGGPDRAVIGVDEDEGRYLANQLAEGPGDMRLIRVSAQKIAGPGWDLVARKGWLSEMRKGRQVASIDLRQVAGLPGAHNHQNAACAYGVARALGLSPKEIEAGFHSFEGLPHRSQRVAEINGVSFVNDSKATNVDAAVKALGAFTRIRWICGGLEKEGGMSALAPAAGGVVKAYVIGREAAAFALHLGDVPHEVCGDMATAVARAAAEAEPGDTVLLAPAAASFDQYDSFEHRGRDFMEQVARLQG